MASGSRPHSLPRAYTKKIRALLGPAERKIFSSLSSPQKIQDFLDLIPINFELSGETNLPPRQVLVQRRVHCLEAAVFAAAVLAYHDQRPLLMDLQTTYGDEDHVIALFTQKGFWGAISKTNHSILRYRDAIYKTPRELAMSYVHEYFMADGKISMRAYSKPFDLSRCAPEKWVTAGESLDWLPEAIDKSPHFPILPSKYTKLRRVSRIAVHAADASEWNKNGALRRLKGN